MLAADVRSLLRFPSDPRRKCLLLKEIVFFYRPFTSSSVCPLIAHVTGNGTSRLTSIIAAERVHKPFEKTCLNTTFLFTLTKSMEVWRCPSGISYSMLALHMRQRCEACTEALACYVCFYIQNCSICNEPLHKHFYSTSLFVWGWSCLQLFNYFIPLWVLLNEIGCWRQTRI